jgi:hypothetical protein
VCGGSHTDGQNAGSVLDWFAENTASAERANTANLSSGKMQGSVAQQPATVRRHRPKQRDAEETEGSGGSRDCAMTPTDGRWRAGSVDESTLPEKVFLPVRMGGLGLTSYAELAEVAHRSSLTLTPQDALVDSVGRYQ